MWTYCFRLRVAQLCAFLLGRGAGRAAETGELSQRGAFGLCSGLCLGVWLDLWLGGRLAGECAPVSVSWATKWQRQSLGSAEMS